MEGVHELIGIAVAGAISRSCESALGVFQPTYAHVFRAEPMLACQRRAD